MKKNRTSLQTRHVVPLNELLRNIRDCHSRLHIYKDSAEKLVTLCDLHEQTRPLRAMRDERDAGAGALWKRRLYDHLCEWASWDIEMTLAQWATIRGTLIRNCNIQSARPSLDPSVLETLNAIQIVLSTRQGIKSLKRFTGSEAQSVVDIFDAAIVFIPPGSGLFKTALQTLRSICIRNRCYPSSFVFLPGTLHIISNDPVGSGGFADIWLGQYESQRVAVKAIRGLAEGEMGKAFEDFCSEAVTWRYLTHPNITRCFGIYRRFRTLCIVCEWMPHSRITIYLQENPGADRLKLVLDIAVGLEFLHSVGVVHGDLTSANILVNSEGRACLSDFGLAVVLNDTRMADSISKNSIRPGATRWMAPEVLDPEAYKVPKGVASPKSDVYSLAMVIWEVYTGYHPYTEHKRDPAIIHQILTGARPQRPPVDQAPELTDTIWEVMEDCWQNDRERRPSVAGVIEKLRSASSVFPICKTSSHNDLIPHMGTDVLSEPTVTSRQEKCPDQRRDVDRQHDPFRSTVNLAVMKIKRSHIPSEECIISFAQALLESSTSWDRNIVYGP